MKTRLSCIVVLCVCLLSSTGIGQEESQFRHSQTGDLLWQYINPFIGSGGEGHCYPGATVPCGMVQPGPDTHLPDFNNNAFPWCAGYQYNDSSIIGFSQTHFSGTGHSDMGDVLIMPTVGPLQLQSGTREFPDSGYRSRISKNEEWAEAGYYAVMLKKYNIKTEITASTRVAFYRFTFPQADTARLILDLVSSIYNYNGKVIWASIRVENPTTITGYRQTKGWGPDRKVYFAIQISKPFTSYGFVNEEVVPYRGCGGRSVLTVNYPEGYGKKLKAYFNFKTMKNEEVLMKVTISGVGIDGALKNLETEIPHWNFEEVRLTARAAWEKELQKIRIEASVKEKQIFYTSVYHSLLAPVIYMDVDGRYRGVDGNIHTANNFTNYTIFSLWDTYRAENPLFTITQRDRVSDIVQSFLARSGTERASYSSGVEFSRK